jgi:UDP-N-acetylglucosamine--N-acetylmuramyl-(pentapeptide) pyrophosphoryl-undecaprenol N-acetylglucosamine transferase
MKGNALSPDQRPPRLLIAAGGTGGHIYPGLAVGKAFIARHPAAKVMFIGTSRGLEERIIGAEGFPVHPLRAAPLRGGSLLRKVKGVLALAPALRDAYRLLRELRPDAVFGVGGYTAGPLLLAASLRRVPTLILEPNFDPGLTNRCLAPFVDAAAVAWEETARHFGNKAFVSGNPIRPEIAAVPDLRVEDRLRVLLVGGSQGSRVLNDTMIDALPYLDREIEITHQTGDNDLERVRAAYERARRAARIEPYLAAIEEDYARCHVVVSRAGAGACAELAAAGRGAILVPLEIAGAHQTHNAEALERHGAAKVIAEDELSGERLASILNDLAADPRAVIAMGEAARAHARPHAATDIVAALESLIERS